MPNKKAKTGRRGELNTPVWSSARRRFRSTRGPQVRGDAAGQPAGSQPALLPPGSRAGARRPAADVAAGSDFQSPRPGAPARALGSRSGEKASRRPRGPPRKAPSAADPARVPPAADVTGRGSPRGSARPGRATWPAPPPPRPLRPLPATCRPAPVPAVPPPLPSRRAPGEEVGRGGGPAARPEGGGGPGGRAAGEGSRGGSRAPPHPGTLGARPAHPKVRPAASGPCAETTPPGAPVPTLLWGVWFGVRRDFHRVAATCAVAQPPWVLPRDHRQPLPAGLRLRDNRCFFSELWI